MRTALTDPRLVEEEWPVKDRLLSYTWQDAAAAYFDAISEQLAAGTDRVG